MLGASGVAFMMILLASAMTIRRGEIPLTFVAVAILYLGVEVYRELYAHDQISHLTHLVGGVAGAAFGFIAASTRRGGTAARRPGLTPREDGRSTGRALSAPASAKAAR